MIKKTPSITFFETPSLPTEDETEQPSFTSNELKDLKQSLQHVGRLNILGQVSANLAHELSNPVSVINGIIDSLLSDIEETHEAPDVKDLKKNLEKINKASTRMSHVIYNILKFSRKSEESKAKVALKDVIEGSIDFLLGLKSFSNIKFNFNCSEDFFIYGDETQLAQVFINFFSNAKDAILERAQNDEGTIDIELNRRNDEITVRIKDNGLGMTEEAMNKLFVPFHTTKPAGKGTGLGLTISLNIIQDHQGKVECQSEHGKGTEFTITFPACN